MVAGGRDGVGIIRELGMDMYMLRNLKWIISKVLLYSTGNSAQYYVAAWMGGGFGGEWTHGQVFPRGSVVKPANGGDLQETRVRSLGQEDPLEEEMATHSSILAWRIPRTEESGGLQFMDCKELDMTKCLTTTRFLL